MGLLSSSVSVTRYKVNGRIQNPVIETITSGLKKNVIQDIDGEDANTVVGWTDFDDPFQPKFESSSLIVGPYLIFSMRMDKKSIPAKVVQKNFSIESAKRLAKNLKAFLSRNEKKEIKDQVIRTLTLRIPATPNVYDAIWSHEQESVWLFTHQKTACEAFETLFFKSFNLSLIRYFPFTMADLLCGLEAVQRDTLSRLTPTRFAG